jgi:uncharacterized Zn-binding protein involved in type VI secretion
MGMPVVCLGDSIIWVNPSSGPTPGNIMLGSPNVMAGGKPLSGLGDASTGGPITMGSASVMVGGKPVARLGDPTAMSGSILVGNPTVLAA